MEEVVEQKLNAAIALMQSAFPGWELQSKSSRRWNPQTLAKEGVPEKYWDSGFAFEIKLSAPYEHLTDPGKSRDRIQLQYVWSDRSNDRAGWLLSARLKTFSGQVEYRSFQPTPKEAIASIRQQFEADMAKHQQFVENLKGFAGGGDRG